MPRGATRARGPIGLPRPRTPQQARQPETNGRPQSKQLTGMLILSQAQPEQISEATPLASSTRSGAGINFRDRGGWEERRGGALALRSRRSSLWWVGGRRLRVRRFGTKWSLSAVLVRGPDPANLTGSRALAAGCRAPHGTSGARGQAQAVCAWLGSRLKLRPGRWSPGGIAESGGQTWTGTLSLVSKVLPPSPSALGSFCGRAQGAMPLCSFVY